MISNVEWKQCFQGLEMYNCLWGEDGEGKIYTFQLDLERRRVIFQSEERRDVREGGRPNQSIED